MKILYIFTLNINQTLFIVNNINNEMTVAEKMMVTPASQWIWWEVKGSLYILNKQTNDHEVAISKPSWQMVLSFTCQLNRGNIVLFWDYILSIRGWEHAHTKTHAQKINNKNKMQWNLKKKGSKQIMRHAS